MKKTIILILSISFFWTCRKKDLGGDVSGSSYIRGRLYLNDPTSPILATPLSKKTVWISINSADTTNYLFSDTTDINGYFVFQNLKSGPEYRLYYQDTLNSIIYTAIDSTKAPVDAFPLTAGLSANLQNGIWAKIVDGAGAAVANATLYLFQTPSTGYATNSGTGSDYQVISDHGGNAYKFNLFPVNYYLLASATINNLPYVAKSSVALGNVVKFVTLPLLPPNGVQFVTTDASGEIVPGVSICIFTNQLLSSQGTCDGSNFHLVSDTTGVASKYNIAPGKYYINCLLTAGKDTLIKQTSITITDKILYDTIALAPK